jgi:heat shock protein HslJ
MLPRLLALLCLALVAACGSSKPRAESTPAPRVFGQWELIELNGQAMAFDDRAPSLALAPDGKVAGFAGVNRFTGQADSRDLREGRFAVGALAVTKMAGSAEQMAFERRYLAALEGAERIQVRDGVLELWDGSTCLARFEPPH